MAVTSRSVPRFLPTLTEVVHLPVPEAPANDDAVEQQAIAESVRLHVDALLDQRLREAVATVLLGQVDAITARLRQQIEPMVQQVLVDVVARERAGKKLS